MGDDKTDWYGAAALASDIDVAFDELRRLVVRDVGRANEAHEGADLYVVNDDAMAKTIVVERAGTPVSQFRWVAFEKMHGAFIEVRFQYRQGYPAASFTVSPRWSPEDRLYRLETSEKEPVELWQVSRRALVPLFFGPTPQD